MKKILLVALNAKYIHTNPAIHSLNSYAKKYKENLDLEEFTINNHLDDIIETIYKKRPYMIGFSCYIWNIDMITRIIPELKKVMPDVKIWFGGPEVSYNPIEYLNKYKELDGLVIGEGEQTFLELLNYYIEEWGELSEIKGIAYKETAHLDNKKGFEGVKVTEQRKASQLNDLPFLYENIDEFKNRIIYYESSKGCPFSCSYCLSSVDRKVRLRDLDLVKKELKIFLEHEVAQVKFIDRTFNCNKKHAMAIWEFIKENDNGITNFHFEISADLLSEEELELLRSMRPGQVQFEIGIQSTNSRTLKAINRQMDLEKLASNVEVIRKEHNIHQHLDLIAGLPYEDYKSFAKSFNDVYAMKPNQLQLGFLKILKGSPIERDSEVYSIVYQEIPPYEVLFTKWLSYDELIKLKGISKMIEVYYNSDQFNYSMDYLERRFDTAFDLYEALSDYYLVNNLDKVNHSRNRRFEILMSFYKECKLIKGKRQVRAFGEILYLDMCLRENVKAIPEFAPQPLDYKYLKEACESYGLNRKFAKIEKFSIDVRASATEGKPVGKEQFLLFDYTERDPLSNSARLILVDDSIIK